MTPQASQYRIPNSQQFSAVGSQVISAYNAASFPSASTFTGFLGVIGGPISAITLLMLRFFTAVFSPIMFPHRFPEFIPPSLVAIPKFPRKNFLIYNNLINLHRPFLERSHQLERLSIRLWRKFAHFFPFFATTETVAVRGTFAALSKTSTLLCPAAR